MSRMKKLKTECSGVGIAINFCLGIQYIVIPFFILHYNLFALIHVTIISTFSALNLSFINGKNALVTCISFSYNKYGKRETKKDFSIKEVVTILPLSVCIFYASSILFGAPLAKECASTMYFSIFMSLLTAYPLMWYLYFCDNLATVMKVLWETKSEDKKMVHFVLSAVIGSWVGALPIPLDWERPWQKWPITCCSGASWGISIWYMVQVLQYLQLLLQDKQMILSKRCV